LVVSALRREILAATNQSQYSPARRVSIFHTLANFEFGIGIRSTLIGIVSIATWASQWHLRKIVEPTISSSSK
jgi:hypothetical protein